VTLALNSDNSIAWQAGWGNNQSELASEGLFLIRRRPSGSSGVRAEDQATAPEFNTSVETVWPGSPSRRSRKHVPGKYRQLPDISWLADPIHRSGNCNQRSGPDSGTGLAGVGRHERGLPDVLRTVGHCQSRRRECRSAKPHSTSIRCRGSDHRCRSCGSKTNVTASIQESTGTNSYTTERSVGWAHVGGAAKFVSAIWDYPFIEDTSLVISFGTDCSALPSTDFDDGPPATARLPCTRKWAGTT
jgi:hypothetical protein